MRNAPTIVAALFIMLFAETFLLISTWDYKIALEQENEQLKAQLAAKSSPSKEVFESVLCPPNWRHSVQQRIDKRRWDGVITRSKWKGVCT